MSFPDYNQTVDDHRSLLILVKQVGCHLNPKAFNEIYSRISQIHKVNIHSQQRVIRLRYTKSYPPESNEWGEFQAHRKVVGLVCLGKCANEDEVSEVYRLYQDIDRAYGTTLYDSRLILFGVNKDGHVLDQSLECLDKCDARVKDISQIGGLDNGHMIGVDQRVKPSSSENKDTSSPAHLDCGKDGGSTSKAHVLFYPDEEHCPDLEEKLQDYVASLFWILDSKRLDRSHERQEKPPLLMTPFEKKEQSRVDTDSRTYKKKCQARLRKHLGDLCLLAGLPGEALLHYQTSLEVLKSSSDWMWLGGAYEGMCAASVAIAKPHTETTSFPRNLSFSSFSTKRGLAAQKDRFRPGGLSQALNGLDLHEGHTKSNLAVDEVLDKYKEAILNYSKFDGAGVVELEASLKACHIAIEHKKHMTAAEFLQNVVYINLQLTDSEKIQRYSVLSELYDKAGMRRKGALFRRLAGMQCVATTNPKPAWNKCYLLLVEALEGYKMTLDVKDRPKGYSYGWPLLQMRVLHEMIYSARKMGKPAVAIRHLCYLLHAMFPHLSRPERQELANVLQSYTARCESPAKSLTLDNGTVLPPVTFTHFPLVKAFRFSEPPPHLRPKKLKSRDSLTDSESSGASLFIYSPLQQRNKVKPKSDITWVQGDSCDCLLQLYNPLPFELKISHLNILTEGCKCEFVPQTLSLPAESGPYQVKVLGTLQQSGTLIVTGYSTKVLGVWSNCLLQDLDEVPEDEIVVKVTPVLPTLSLKTTLPKDASFSSQENSDSVVTSGLVCVYAGQRCECSLLMTNTSSLPVEYMSLTVQARHNLDLLKTVVVWNDVNLTSQLPLQSGHEAVLTLYVCTTSDILTALNTDLMVTSKQSVQECDDVSSSKVLECLLKVEYSGGDGFKENCCRQCAVTLVIEILPSVIIRNWNVLPAQSESHCHLVLELENVTSHTMEILNGDTCLLVIGSGQCKRCAIQLLRCDPVAISSSPSGDECHTHHALIEHLTRMTDITWRLPSEDKEGNLSLNKLAFTPEQMTLLQVSTLKWEVILSGSECTGSPCNQCDCGDLCTISWRLYNGSDEELSKICAKLSVTQSDFSSIQCTDVIGTNVITVGMSGACLDKLFPGDVFSQQCPIVFLQSGTYKVKVICQCQGCGPDEIVTHQSPALSVTVTDPTVVPSDPAVIVSQLDRL